MNGRVCELGSNPVEVRVRHLRRKPGALLVTPVHGVGDTLGQET